MVDFKSFEVYEVVLKLFGNYNLRLVNIYCFLLFIVNGFSVVLFFEEFFIYFEYLNLVVGFLLMFGDFNFYVDWLNDFDLRWFMSILDFFDLN